MASKLKRGTPAEFFAVPAEVAEILRVKSALAVCLIRERRESQLSQQQLAEIIGSSQSRVAKMEAADPSVSMELLIKGLLAAGSSMEKIGAVLATGDADAEWKRRMKSGT